jgi:hypothetical protein
MKMKLPALLLACMFVFAGSASALNVDNLIAVGEMPLAVADVAALPDLPQNDLMTVVAALNQAAVPAPQFIEIVRYVPVAVVNTTEPRFATYVVQEYDRGIVGEPLVEAIATRYNVVSRFQPVEFNPLALIAMPLAVAAVSNLTDVPQNDLMSLVASLNRALVPAPQFVEVVRYSPVVLVDPAASPRFIQFVTTEVDRGVIGQPLAFAIAERIETFQPVDINLTQSQQVLVDRDVVLPPVVVTREASVHPHGGPPGQLKKQLGLQTGAEVVHGTRPGKVARSRAGEHERFRPEKVRVSAPAPAPVSAPPVMKEKGGNRGNHGNPGNASSNKGGGGDKHGNSGGGQGKGKGKGKG